MERSVVCIVGGVVCTKVLACDERIDLLLEGEWYSWDSIQWFYVPDPVE